MILTSNAMDQRAGGSVDSNGGRSSSSSHTNDDTASALNEMEQLD